MNLIEELRATATKRHHPPRPEIVSKELESRAADELASKEIELDLAAEAVVHWRSECERLTAENERLRDMLSPDAILYALEHAGFVVSESELFEVCRKLGVHQQTALHLEDEK